MAANSKTDLKLAWCSYEAAKYAVLRWHYSKRMPKSKLAKIGVWENGKFIGALIFGVGATSKLVRRYGLKPEQGCELVRVALDRHATHVSRIISISISLIKKSFQLLRLVVSFADPTHGHCGSIYKAGGWLYTGLTDDAVYYIVNNRITHPRAISLMVKSKAIPNRGVLPKIIQNGKHRYLMPLDSGMRERLKSLVRPYPCAGSIVSDAAAVQAAEGGATPTPALSND